MPTDFFAGLVLDKELPHVLALGQPLVLEEQVAEWVRAFALYIYPERSSRHIEVGLERAVFPCRYGFGRTNWGPWNCTDTSEVSVCQPKVGTGPDRRPGGGHREPTNSPEVGQ